MVSDWDYWKTHDDIGRHLERVFTKNGTKRVKASRLIFDYYQEQAHKENPNYSWARCAHVALETIDDIMCNNPYKLADIGQNISLSFIDNRVTALSAYDDWYVSPDSVIRLRLIAQQVLKGHYENGCTVISALQFKNELRKKFVDGLKNQHDNSIAFLSFDSLFDELERRADAPWTEAENFSGESGIKYIIAQQYLDMASDLSNYLKWQMLDKGRHRINRIYLDKAFDELYSSLHIDLDKNQRECVERALKAPLSLILGYAGTGKTTLVRAITTYLSSLHKNFLLTAITGKACENLLGHTGVTDSSKAPTIASLLLEARQSKDGELKDLDYLIVDEVSMVSEKALLALLKLLPRKANLILIGDRAQLPAIKAPGSLADMSAWDKLHDMDVNKRPKREKFFKCVLTHVYRQNPNDLLKTVTSIRNNICPTRLDRHVLDKSIRYIPVPLSVKDVANSVYDHTKQYYHLNDTDIMVIASANDTANEFNEQLESRLVDHHGKPFLKFNDQCFIQGDRVLVTKNMYGVDSIGETSKDVRNGFIGTVVACYPAKDNTRNIPGDILSIYPHLIVRFKKGKGAPWSADIPFMASFEDTDSSFAKRYDVGYAKLDNLKLGYGLTIHKAQGSTLNTVIVYVSLKHIGKMFNREALYTALTRAHDQVVVTFGDDDCRHKDQPKNKSLDKLLQFGIDRSIYDGCYTYLSTCMADEYIRPESKRTRAQRREAEEDDMERVVFSLFEDD